MSTSFYRGKLVTSSELKGAFTEAYDEIKGRPFDILKNSVSEVAKGNAKLACRYSPGSVSLQPSVTVWLGPVMLQLKEDGSFEIWEGGE